MKPKNQPKERTRKTRVANPQVRTTRLAALGFAFFGWATLSLVSARPALGDRSGVGLTANSPGVQRVLRTGAFNLITQKQASLFFTTKEEKEKRNREWSDLLNTRNSNYSNIPNSIFQPDDHTIYVYDSSAQSMKRYSRYSINISEPDYQITGIAFTNFTGAAQAHYESESGTTAANPTNSDTSGSSSTPSPTSPLATLNAGYREADYLASDECAYSKTIDRKTACDSAKKTFEITAAASQAANASAGVASNLIGQSATAAANEAGSSNATAAYEQAADLADKNAKIMSSKAGFDTALGAVQAWVAVKRQSFAAKFKKASEEAKDGNLEVSDDSTNIQVGPTPTHSALITSAIDNFELNDKYDAQEGQTDDKKKKVARDAKRLLEEARSEQKAIAGQATQATILSLTQAATGFYQARELKKTAQSMREMAAATEITQEGGPALDLTASQEDTPSAPRTGGAIGGGGSLGQSYAAAGEGLEEEAYGAGPAGDLGDGFNPLGVTDPLAQGGYYTGPLGDTGPMGDMGGGGAGFGGMGDATFGDAGASSPYDSGPAGAGFMPPGGDTGAPYQPPLAGPTQAGPTLGTYAALAGGGQPSSGSPLGDTSIEGLLSALKREGGDGEKTPINGELAFEPKDGRGPGRGLASEGASGKSDPIQGSEVDLFKQVSLVYQSKLAQGAIGIGPGKK